VAALAQASVLPASRCEASALPVLHDWLCDPVDARVVSDDCVRGVHKDDLQFVVVARKL
jgi:hypothetical protein